jgi:3-keto-5-aminohexanoate cleavage enzyme
MKVPGTPQMAVTLAEALPAVVTWSIFGVGATQFPMVAMGVLLNAHVRVGFKDNLYLKRGQMAKSNAELVIRTVEIIRGLNKDVASVDEARKILGIV